MAQWCPLTSDGVVGSVCEGEVGWRGRAAEREVGAVQRGRSSPPVQAVGDGGPVQSHPLSAREKKGGGRSIRPPAP